MFIQSSTYTVIVNEASCTSQTKNVVVSPGQNSTLNFALNCTGIPPPPTPSGSSGGAVFGIVAGGLALAFLSSINKGRGRRK